MDQQAISLEAVTLETRPVLAHLLELYVHDMSAMFDVEIGADGRFGHDDLHRHGMEDGEHFAFFVRAGERLAGFALATRGSPASDDPEHLDVAEFFILRRHRRTGLGREAAFLLWNRLRGRWIVRVSNANLDALPFWRSAVQRYTDGVFDESQHPGGAHGWHVFAFDSKGSSAATGSLE